MGSSTVTAKRKKTVSKKTTFKKVTGEVTAKGEIVKKAVSKKLIAKKAKKTSAKKRPAPKKLTPTQKLQSRIDKLTGLLEVAKAMPAMRELDPLLKLILTEAVRVVGADRCTLWIIDPERDELWTKVAQGLGEDERIRIPVGVGIAGQVAATGEVINIPEAYADKRFNRQVDKDTGYRTHHILAVPMVSTHGEVTGVLQALNKLDPFEKQFNDEDTELLMALGANAAAAVENAILYEEIDTLFEGFVTASVVAIESRDPTTSGHSERVARLTAGMASSLEHVQTGPYAGVTFSRDDMKEIRYAALLHDFGKVGVRENVLVKAKKLYPGELDVIETRFQALAAQIENRHLRATIQAIRDHGELPPDYEQAPKQELAELQRFLALVRGSNEPTILESGSFEQLRDIAQLTFTDVDNKQSALLTERELHRLSIPRGTLDEAERLEIESHVTHTFRFLAQIPWTRSLRRIPEIAYAHHEKLDGGGYPRQLIADQIPAQARMMTIADIYDALTASDRPYKRAVPHEKACDILLSEAKKSKIDADLLQIFFDAKIHHSILDLQIK